MLESEDASLGVVEALVGQTRMELIFTGQANHAGTTPMHLRHDAMAAAAEWIVAVEDYARSHDGLVATVGKVEASPGAGNVIAGSVTASLDVRHADDSCSQSCRYRDHRSMQRPLQPERGVQVTIAAHSLSSPPSRWIRT